MFRSLSFFALFIISANVCAVSAEEMEVHLAFCSANGDVFRRFECELHDGKYGTFRHGDDIEITEIIPPTPLTEAVRDEIAGTVLNELRTIALVDKAAPKDPHLELIFKYEAPNRDIRITRKLTSKELEANTRLSKFVLDYFRLKRKDVDKILR